MKFSELRAEEFDSAVIILDIDGTIAPAGSDTIDVVAEKKISELREKNDIYLLSNRNAPGRTLALAKTLGVSGIDVPYRKPDIRAVRGIKRENKEVVVIGDKVLTDGLFAFFIGARFIKVARVLTGDESFFDLAVNAADNVVFALWLLLRLARPEQWVKNLLVLAPIFFAGKLFVSSALIHSLIAVVAFSLLASAGYVLNDLVDRKSDRLHPEKCRRPIAQGDISAKEAGLYTFVLVYGAFALSSWTALPMTTLYCLAAYFALTVAYSLYFKRVPILEMIFFIGFYLMRIAVGGFAAEVAISSWIILTTGFSALFLVTAKRYTEAKAGRTREVLAQYSEIFLQIMLSVSASLVLISYGLYSILDAKDGGMVYSTLFVLFGVMRYLQIAFSDVEAEYPERVFFRDRLIQVSVLGWVIFMFFMYY